MRLREWATPLTMGAFALMAATGILMFFHLDTGLNKPAHEWLGWAMVVGVGLHAWANWGAFKRYFSNRAALGIMGLFALVLAGSFTPVDRGPLPPHKQVVQVVLDAPLEQVARLAGKDPAVVTARLRQAGFEVTPDRSLRQALAGPRDRQLAALGVILAD
jgi:hypothetical protein